MVNKPWKLSHNPSSRPLGCNGKYGQSGARLHRRRGEKVCKRCSKSGAHYQRERRRGEFQGPPPLRPCGTPSAAARHKSRGEPIDLACRLALAKQQQELRDRQRREMDGVPSRGPYSPYSAGARTLLARTCMKCGELVDGDSFPVLNRGKRNQSRRRVCHNCHNGRKKQDREERGIGLPPTRPREELQINKYRKWTKEEDQKLKDGIEEGTSYEDIAVELGRSLRAVYTRREILGIAKVRPSHRVEKPWKISQ